MNNWLCIYEDKKKIFPSQITEDEVYPYRVKVKPLIERLEFITNKRKWSGYLVGKAMREIRERDYEVMRGVDGDVTAIIEGSR